MGCQRFKGCPNVDLRATRNAQVQVWEVEVDEFLYKYQDLVARGWHPSRVGTLVKRIENKIDRDMC